LGGSGAGLRRKLEIAALVSYINHVDSGHDPLSQRKYRNYSVPAPGFPAQPSKSGCCLYRSAPIDSVASGNFLE
jgi:hypothetical protein